jgi:hypothetical protein
MNVSGTGWTTLSTLAADATRATIANGQLENDTTYQFRVAAVNASGATPSNELGGTTASLPQTNHNPVAPYAPRYLSLVNPRLKWNRTNITYSVNATTDGRSTALIEAAVQKAFARWSSATNNLVTFTKVASGADIPITFVPPGDASLEGAQGKTSYITSSSGGNRDILDSTTMKIRSGLAEGSLIALVSHEIGHALGITAHSDNSADAMAAVVDAKRTISARDVNTLAALYLTSDTN